MRPQDIVILLKMISQAKEKCLVTSLASDLGISQSEVSESLQRSKSAKLLSRDKYRVYRSSLLEFLMYGIKYVFPIEFGEEMKGVPTAHSMSPLSDLIISKESLVWPYSEGTQRGMAVNPLYKTVPIAVQTDKKLYEMLALVDTLRIGRPREFKLAQVELEKRIYDGA